MRFLSIFSIALALVCGAAWAHAAEADQPESLWDLMQGKYDANKDGVIQKSEYTRGDAAFAKCDRNQDGVLTSADYRRPAMGPRPPRGPRDARAPRPRPDRPLATGMGGPPPGPQGRRPAPTCPHCGKELPPPPRAQGPHGRGRGPRGQRPPRPPHPPKPDARRPDAPKPDDAPPPPPPAPKPPEGDG